MWDRCGSQPVISASGKQGKEVPWTLLCCCGSLNVFDPHKLIGNDTIRRHGLVGEHAVLLEEVG